ncbi:hypothetical protein GCM10010357_55480 [Streptomyces luteireticuli]|uniref:Uncharacterized protein n=1 Tax=Streptomyces luteireticuli TaxID=173858 RepID=A0ABP3IU21_9ACTN
MPSSTTPEMERIMEGLLTGGAVTTVTMGPSRVTASRNPDIREEAHE